jgi:hypothetical protein
MKEQGNPLADLAPGDRVKGEVVAVEKCGAVVKLENGIQGIATPKLCKGTLWNSTNNPQPSSCMLVIDFVNRFSLFLFMLHKA